MNTVSLIITTYNWPEALNKTLHSIIYQTYKPDEIIIADDGSTAETTLMIQKFITSNPYLNIIHSWQEDNGFQLSKSRNLAIKRSTCDYIIIIDGDMILDRYFIEDHLSIAKKNLFISGRRIRLNEKYSNDILKNNKFPSVLSLGISKHRFLGLRNKVLCKLRSSINIKTNGIVGCNMAFYREDAINVNGFNESFIGWGAEDTEFMARLINNGCKKMKLKHLAIGYHLYHPEVSRKMTTINYKILNSTLEKKLKYCKNGISKQ